MTPLFSVSPSPRQWLRNPGPQHEKRTLFGDMVCFLFITPLATISGWLCLRGAVDHLHFSSRLEAVGLIALTVALFTIYLFWTLVSMAQGPGTWSSQSWPPLSRHSPPSGRSPATRPGERQIRRCWRGRACRVRGPGGCACGWACAGACPPQCAAGKSRSRKEKAPASESPSIKATHPRRSPPPGFWDAIRDGAWRFLSLVYVPRFCWDCSRS